MRESTKRSACTNCAVLSRCIINTRRRIKPFARLLFISPLNLILLFNIGAVFHLKSSKAEVSASSASQISKKFSLPPQEGAWQLKIVSSGGYLGGKRSLILTSEGNAAAGRNYPYACTAKLSAEELQRLEQLVLRLKFDEDEEPEQGIEKKGADEIRTRLEIHRRGRDGLAHTYTFMWLNQGENSVSETVFTLHRVMAEIEKRIIDKCREYR